jgi:hypothetical protein
MAHLLKYFNNAATVQERDDMLAVLQQELLLKARLGDVEGVKNLLAQGVSADTKDEFGVTALMNAAQGVDHKNAREISKLLIEHGADIDIQDQQGMTALMHAVANGGLGVAKELIRSFTDLSIKNNENMTALEMNDQAAHPNGAMKTLLEAKKGAAMFNRIARMRHHAEKVLREKAEDETGFTSSFVKDMALAAVVVGIAQISKFMPSDAAVLETTATVEPLTVDALITAVQPQAPTLKPSVPSIADIVTGG